LDPQALNDRRSPKSTESADFDSLLVAQALCLCGFRD
jgi:hypothetical protein